MVRPLPFLYRQILRDILLTALRSHRYHAFYHPADQQLAIVAQLCVALVQDLGLSRNTAARDSKWSIATCAISSRPTGSLTEKRAYLGTFFLTVT
jgi:hypothetical protein